jgi:hypothetical protein
MRLENEHPSNESAEESLESFARARQAGALRGVPPAWFIAVTAIWVGAMITLLGNEQSHSTVGLLALLMVVMTVSMRDRMGAWISYRIGIKLRVLGLTLILGLAAVSVFGGSNDMFLVSVGAGCVAAIAVWVFFQFKRKAALKRD